MKSRGAYRLELARKMLKLPAGTDTLSHIKALPESEQEHLRGLVDWVEDYDKLDRSVSHAEKTA